MTEIVNDAFLEIAGKPRELFEQEAHWTIFKEIASEFEPILTEVIATGISYRAEEAGITLVRHGVPELVYISLIYEPIRDTRGVIVKIMICVSDITPKVLSRKRIERSEQNLRNTIMQAPVAMSILRGPEHVVEIANNRMYELWGKSAKELFGKPIFEGLQEARNQGFEALLGNVYKTGKSYSAMGIPVNLPRDQRIETIYINMLFEPYQEENDEVSGIVVVATDISQQIKGKQKIEESEAKYRTLFESIDEGFCIIDIIFDKVNQPVDYRFIEINPMFEKQTGLVNAQGKTARELIPDLEPHWFDLYGKVALTGQSVRFTEGSKAMGRWFDVYAFKLGGEESKKVALLFSDISDRKRAEIELTESKEQLQFAIEAAELATWDLNTITNKFTANDRYFKWFGLEGEGEIDNSKALEIIAEEDRQRVILAYTSALDYSQQSKYDIVYTIKPKIGPERILRAKGKAWFNENNFAYRFNGTCEDVTAETNAAKELIHAKESGFRKFEKIANTLPQIVWTSQPDGNLDYFNDQWFAYSGLNFDESTGQGWASTIHPEDLRGLSETWKSCLAHGGLYEVEARIRNKEGYYNWALIRALPVYEDNHTITQWCGTCTLIQDQKESEQKLQLLSSELSLANEEIQATNKDLVNLNEQLIKVNSDMDNFIYTASHDLKAPISNIEGLISALTKNLSKDSLENLMIIKLMPMIHSSIERFKKTLLDLTEITKLQRLDQGEEKVIDINGLIEDIKSDLSGIIQESSGQINLQLNGVNQLKYSSKNLRSVFYNLISNSLKYRSPTRSLVVEIAGAESDDFYIFSIKDNGLGIDLSNKSSMFGMFKRFHNHVEGSGIGLYIVKKILENTGGKIEVESKVGEGSVFKVFFKK